MLHMTLKSEQCRTPLLLSRLCWALFIACVGIASAMGQAAPSPAETQSQYASVELTKGTPSPCPPTVANHNIGSRLESSEDSVATTAGPETAPNTSDILHDNSLATKADILENNTEQIHQKQCGPMEAKPRSSLVSTSARDAN